MCEVVCVRGPGPVDGGLSGLVGGLAIEGGLFPALLPGPVGLWLLLLPFPRPWQWPLGCGLVCRHCVL